MCATRFKIEIACSNLGQDAVRSRCMSGGHLRLSQYCLCTRCGGVEKSKLQLRIRQERVVVTRISAAGIGDAQKFIACLSKVTRTQMRRDHFERDILSHRSIQ